MSTLAGKSFKGKIYFKKSDRVFYLTIADTNIGSLKSLHTFFDEYLDHMLMKFEKKTVQNVEFYDKKKWFIILEH